MIYFKVNKNKGFSLVETLIAITVLMLAIAGPMSLASSGYASSLTSKNRVSAFYLAQDAMEYIRNVRDENIIANNDWMLGFDSCFNSNGCKVDTINDNISDCSANCQPLDFDPSQSFYEYSGSLEGSPFTRKVNMTQLTNPDEVSVSVEVSWYDRGGRSQNFKIKENLLNWQ